MKVLIVSKTHMNTGVCVGGITFDGRFVRLLDNNGHNQSDDCPFKINEAYDITFIEKQNPTPPHIEDILVQSSKYVGRLKDGISMIDFITKRNISKYQTDDPWSSEIQIKYVGLQPTEDIIPKGTLLRVSLARWWSPNDVEVENRCYLQLSGWYK